MDRIRARCSDAHRRVVLPLQREHVALLPLVGCGPAQYLDIPVHDDIGELLIYRGTVAFLRDNRLHTTQVAVDFNYRHRAERMTILMQCGWSGH